ncbi:hypothetical protein P4476_08055 [Ureibacillus terrenus]|uniref:UPF0738 family protein n=1 Tax=Ureibacillus terrenus TaxID=118246 RepID=UPI002E1C3F5F|nr:hypothetical protein [Ureibacillus terrenus]
MRNIYDIDEVRMENDGYYFSLNERTLEIQLKPAGQMLADSDGAAFVYVVEENGGYSYLRFPEKVWGALADILKTKKDPFLTVKGKTIPLRNFADELEMLVFNIEGNGNYGDTFVEKVEAAFREILKSE